MKPFPRRLVMGVMGSGAEEHAELAEPLGRALARAGCHLLTGAGGGVMAAVSRAFHGVEERAGLVIGIVPGDVREDGSYSPKPGYPNPWVEIAVYTHLPLSGREGASPMSRNHINVLSSDALVMLPGGAGTRSELELARRYGKPVFELSRVEQLAEVIRWLRARIRAVGNSSPEECSRK
jgi:uncharacterized protein (TIGR00725 family)